MKPIVGVAGYVMQKDSVKSPYFTLNTVPKEITDALNKVGALPVVIPLSSEADAKEYINQVDALVLAGGDDVDSLLYYEEPQPLIGEIEPERDAFELALIEEAWAQKKPILGICRGLQLLNVASDGTLYQDLSYYVDLEVNHRQKTPWRYATHTVMIEKDSWMGEALGTEQAINSFHHQAIRKLGEDFKAVAWSKDGIIEAIESVDPTQKIMAVQWHPEILVETVPEMIRVFEKFVELI